MSASEAAAEPAAAARAARFGEHARELAALAEAALDEGGAAAIAEGDIGRALAALVRLYAARVQEGTTPPPFAGNHRMAVTDVAIGCSAMMDAVGLEVFELGAWQNMSGLGRLRRAPEGEEARP